MITRRGVGLIAVAVAVFFLASTTRVGWVHLADAVLWGVILLSLIMPWVSAPGLRVARRIAFPARNGLSGPVEGDSVPVSLEIRNSWWLPRFLVSVSYPVLTGEAESQQRAVFFWLWPRSRQALESPYLLDRRGLHTFGNLLVEVTGPFGLFRRRKRVEARDVALVHPRWEPMQKVGALQSAAGEAAGRRRARSGTETAGTRPYAPGDAYRSIHWRNSARSGRLSVREFDAWSHRPLAIAIDAFNVQGEAPESTLDYAARIAASVALLSEREGGMVSVMTGAGESPHFMAWAGVMEHLARLEPEKGPGDLARSIANIESGQRLMAFLTPDSAAECVAVRGAAQRGVAVVAIVFAGSSNGAQGAADVTRTLKSAGIQVITCEPGGMKAALKALESESAEARALRPQSQKEAA